MKNLFQLSSVALLTSLLTVFIYSNYNPHNQVITQERIQAKQVVDNHWSAENEKTRAYIASSPTDFTTAANRTTPAVVSIRSTKLDDWNNLAGQSSGSGVLISANGYITTNNHVIDGATEINVRMDDKREFKAELVGTDPTTDLALLKIEASGLPYMMFGNSDSLLIGEWVLAVGNPFRLQSTVTAGIVSAKGRNINILESQQYGIESFIQTDAVVNPGNSGGALVNTNGELIGINTAIISQNGSYEGYSFAVPSNLAKKVVNDLREFGSVQRGLLGIQIRPVNEELANTLGLESINGVQVMNAFPGGGAEEAGLQQGDVILSVNGRATNSIAALQEQVGGFRPGDKIDVAFIRNGTKRSIEVTLKNQVNSTEILATKTSGILRDLGMEVRNLSDAERRKFDIDGIKIVSIRRGSVIDRTNMVPDYIVTHINKKRIENTTDFIRSLDEVDGKVFLDGFYERYEGEFPYSFRK